MSELHTALKDLNAAAYAAIRAGVDTTQYPDLDRQKLREIARATDKLVDDNAPTVTDALHRAEIVLADATSHRDHVILDAVTEIFKHPNHPKHDQARMWIDLLGEDA
ncbi:hypothetical protein [Celeribacter sp. SCSIO 80788]|uniref:hypothetical protein n=1 Tax=Celeribacter sp. SCSIO 80788 TaxID=3117013 RepID=UPI003DA554F9